jgi:3D (Asp-Asp-Asp) domain-containing protein
MGCVAPVQSLLSALVQTSTFLRLALIASAACALASCAVAPQGAITSPAARRISNVRTTAYCANEGGSGARNATGEYLSGRKVRSASADWSRYPLGTRFRVVGSNDEYVVDDYGGALVGTNTIDLHKANRAEVRKWGTRHVDIDVLQWGSHEQSLKVLRPRKNSRIVRRMIASIEAKKS